jgi:hypothetical protein
MHDVKVKVKVLWSVGRGVAENWSIQSHATKGPCVVGVVARSKGVAIRVLRL